MYQAVTPEWLTLRVSMFDPTREHDTNLTQDFSG